MSKGIESIPIEVSSRILRHISRGIYRSPAGALKELVSNSYDAGSQKVTINTGYPVIDKIVVTDNGKGMTESKFKDIITQIGFSEKNIGEEIDVINSSRKTKRKTIGHYGIGFLAIGQLAKKATIMSKASDSVTGIKVTLDFDQFETHHTKGKTTSKAKDEAEIEREDKKKDRSKPEETFNIGLCTIERVAFDNEYKNFSFTRVELTDIREDVQRQISGAKTSQLFAHADDLKHYSASFQDILKLLREKEKQTSELRINNQKVPRLREYFYEMLLWELAVYSPLPYPNFPIFSKGHELHHFATLSNKTEFELNVDGFILTKPYEEWFWEEKDGFSSKIYKWENEIYYNDYKVSAYLVYQPGTMIRPKAMQGILVRENAVAVGLYDTTFLGYPFNEGTKFNSLTGEIFASGLAGAMNIDRDSFNQTAEEYMALTEWFHKKLYTEVFPEIKLFQKTKESPSRTKSTTLVSEILNSMAKSSKKISKIEFQSLGKSEKNRVKIRNRTIIINSDHKDCDMSAAKREKLLLAMALIIRGYITNEMYEEVSDQLETHKHQIKRN
ncbi:MAG: ATP-binding protein [Bacteroidetes bacterium]|nr:ATP-binding protein [Bacteroidota bacterium]